MRTYREYKESGHQLIGLVPEHWGVIPNGGFFRVKSIKNTEDEQNLSVYRDYGVIRRDSRDDNHNRVSEDISNYKLVEVGDFVLNKMKCWMGSLGVSEYRGIVSPSYTVCEPIREIHRKYFHYLLRSRNYIQIYDSLSYGVRIGQWELRFHDFKKIKSLYPPLSEQKQISDYLDRKTQQIDDLIEKTERKIELLKEQRSSLINQCVTKGLDPNVEMKDSGVEWIGEIPKEWRKIKVSYFCDVRDGTHDTPTYVDEGGVPLVTQKDLVSGKLEFSKTNNISFDDYEDINRRSNVVKNDILMSMIGSLGNPVIVDTDREFSIKNVCLFKTSLIDQNITYFLYFLRSDFMETQLVYMSRGGVQGFVSLDVLRNLIFFLPPLSEQKQISHYLDHETSKIDQMVDTETKRIDLLKEYRQSLISNVVTGKIDVRDEVVQ